MNAGPRRLLAALTAVLAAASSPPLPRPTPKTSSLPRALPTPPRAAGRRGPARWTRRSAPSRPRASSSKTPPATRRSASPSSSSAINQALGPILAPGETDRRTEDRPRRPPGRPQRQPAGDAQCPTATGESNPGPARRTPKSARARSRLRARGGLADGDRRHVYNIDTAGRAAGLFGFSIAGAANVFLRARGLLGRRLSRGVHDRRAPPISGSSRRPDPQEPPRLRRPVRRRHLHHHAVDLLRPGNRRRPWDSVYSTWLQASSIEEEEDPGYEFPAERRTRLESPCRRAKSRSTAPTSPTSPSADVDPGTAATDSPAGATTEVECPTSSAAGEQRELEHREARVSLPAGLGLNPPPARACLTCTDAEFGKGTKAPVACPPASKIGTVEIDPAAARIRRDPRRRRLRRHPAQPRPRLRRRVPDLRRRRVGALRDLRAADRPGQRRPGQRAADDPLRRNCRRSPSAPSS